MHNIPTLKHGFTKSFDEHYEHFSIRLIERYGIEITAEEYKHICSKEYIRMFFKGKFKKQGDKSVGILELKGKKIIILYDRGTKVISTCYPSNIEQDMNGLFFACFGRKQMRYLCGIIYQQIMNDVTKFNRHIFKSNKEAALFIKSNCLFPGLMLSIYFTKELCPWAICRTIQSIIAGTNPHTKISIERIIVN